MTERISKTEGLEALARKAARSAVVHDAPGLHDGEARRVGEDLLEFVRDDDYRVPSLMQRDDQGKYAPDSRIVEVCEWLVEEKAGRAHGEDTCDRESSPLASRKTVGATALKTGEVYEGKGLAGARLDFSSGKAKVRRPEGRILEESLPHYLGVGILKDEADVPARRKCVGRDRTTAVEDRSRARRGESD
jgi:hypothetical protein